MHETEQRQIFDNWLAEHQGILFKVIRAYAHNAHDREDLFQEIALQVWKSVPDYRGEAKVSTWIYRVALYTALAWSRKERTQPQLQDLAAVANTLIANETLPDEHIRWLYEQLTQFEPVERSIFMGTASYLSSQWEVNRCYRPQINSLQALRAKLVAP